jgi:uncharacterized protein involved in exopolysaccharide biosynthesis
VNPHYRETFRRHRLLFLLPVVLGAVLGLTFSLGSPKLYRSTASLWSESASANTAEAFGALPPAGQEQSMLTELLTTYNFVHNVARNSPMQAYLETHTSTGWTPTALLKQLLKGTPSLDDRIATALSPKRVTSTVHGQHILEVSLAAADPVLAKRTLQTLIKEYMRQRAVLAQSVLKSAQQQVDSASKSLAAARFNLNEYLRTHPGLPPNDPERQALTNAYRTGLGQVNTATSAMNQAFAAVASGSGLQSSLRVYDPPKLPIGTTTGKKRAVETAIAGGFVGALLSFLAIMYLSRPGRSEASPGGSPATLPGPSPNGGGPAISEHERAAELLAGQSRNPFLNRRE